ncbi:BufA1 family periplasmic bufferin-type metallophore [Pseudogulbenkiania subflava]|uniref:Uncharacterized membrane protein n=1 Tax=Pseudogulbenkiania subflava DSM 22618 TaxID=1123014 RepID=A0A1Y6BX60_9NEIS|nr:DUF2282 domain-containing protein [Pseudogulbenkiania subflava]SMF23159.1 Uncharacterized membrane protein [Pseudogulbenkiania subflava DSM 22618]SMF32510.1 Uncharacterized membrane protein [Pseudogulbenkiania subflava DSM 22618]SMF47592.1 Uncharacterized membrane protein [Pseudogulbenkiania subflava DSM 22618]
MQSQNVIKAALALSLIGLAAGGQAAEKKMEQPEKKMEQCYGVNAAYKNDCKAPGHSCAGQATKARDPNSFVAMPAGLCNKIEGGSTKPKES